MNNLERAFDAQRWRPECQPKFIGTLLLFHIDRLLSALLPGTHKRHHENNLLSGGLITIELKLTSFYICLQEAFTCGVKGPKIVSVSKSVPGFKAEV